MDNKIKILKKASASDCVDRKNVYFKSIATGLRGKGSQLSLFKEVNKYIILFLYLFIKMPIYG